jgi:hyperosmotically inducible protein
MDAKNSRIGALLITLALLTTPGISLAQNSRYTNPSSAAPASSDISASAPDNTGKNVRDHNRSSLTPFNQSNKASDLDLTRQIRRALMDDKSLSMTAKNIKVISSNPRGESNEWQN